jgi:hypothetical protein
MRAALILLNVNQQKVLPASPKSVIATITSKKKQKPYSEKLLANIESLFLKPESYWTSNSTCELRKGGGRACSNGYECLEVNSLFCNSTTNVCSCNYT